MSALRPRLLYALNGTGLGHIRRAQALIPALQSMADVDVLVSGQSTTMPLPFPVTFSFKGLTFQYRNGKVDLIRSLLSASFRTLFDDYRHFSTRDYDFVITDFEPISSWAARRDGTFCIHLSNQASFRQATLAKPPWRPHHRLFEWGISLLCVADRHIGIHLTEHSPTLWPPIAQPKRPTQNNGRLLVYLYSYPLSKLVPLFRQLNQDCDLFHPDCQEAFSVDHVHIYPLGPDYESAFLNCDTLITHAGFQSIVEALSLQKQLVSVPIQGQYEQTCNGLALDRLGVPCLSQLDLHPLQEALSKPPCQHSFSWQTPDTYAQQLYALYQGACGDE